MRRRIQEFIVNWGRACWREATSCRECDHPVRLLDDVCPHCGAANPGRIRTTAVVVLSLPIVLTLLYAFIQA
jgi:hypothetical protein